MLANYNLTTVHFERNSVTFRLKHRLEKRYYSAVRNKRFIRLCGHLMPLFRAAYLFYCCAVLSVKRKQKASKHLNVGGGVAVTRVC